MVATIPVAALLITGENCSDAYKADVDAVAGALPDSRGVILAGEEHFADVLAPERFSRRLLEFLYDDS